MVDGAAVLGTPNAGATGSPVRRPADEADFTVIQRGIMSRAVRAGFIVELTAGIGPAGRSYRMSGRRDARSGLIRFSLTRLIPDETPEDVLTYVQFRLWPPRSAKLAELRAELDLIATMEGRQQP